MLPLHKFCYLNINVYVKIADMMLLANQDALFSSLVTTQCNKLIISYVIFTFRASHLISQQ